MSSQSEESADIGANSKNQSKCPKCGSPNYIPIVYGYPSPEAFEKAERGELILAGCCIFEENPPVKCCKNCRHQYI